MHSMTHGHPDEMTTTFKLADALFGKAPGLSINKRVGDKILLTLPAAHQLEEFTCTESHPALEIRVVI